MGDGRWKTGDGGRRTEDGGRKTEDGGRRTEDGGRGTEDGGRRTEDGGRRTEDGGRKTEDGGRGTEDGGEGVDGGGPCRAGYRLWEVEVGSRGIGAPRRLRSRACCVAPLYGLWAAGERGQRGKRGEGRWEIEDGRNMSMKFEDLESWQKARALVNGVYTLTRTGSLARDYGSSMRITFRDLRAAQAS